MKRSSMRGGPPFSPRQLLRRFSALRKRRVSRNSAVALIAGALLLSGGAAYAYWTAGGSGSDTVASGTNVPITVNQTTTVAGLAPGLPPQTLGGNFDNPNTSLVYVTAVTATVSGTSIVGCGPSDYLIAGVANVNAQIPAGIGVGAWSGLTIQFNNKPDVDQSVCKDAEVTIAYTST